MLRSDPQWLESRRAQQRGAEFGGVNSTNPGCVIDPKPWASQQSGPNDWFKFYAGYNHEFAYRLLASASQEERAADPWNGSGATTTAAAVLGIECHGFDLNPAMVVVARSRLVCAEAVAAAVNQLFQIEATEYGAQALEINEIDPLLQWFGPASVRAFRWLEQTVGEKILGVRAREQVAIAQNATAIPLGCLLYTALFQTVRRLVDSFRPSNPTWLQIPKPKARLRPSVGTIVEEFRSVLHDVKAAHDAGPAVKLGHRSAVSWGSSAALPLESQSIDLIVTSPPYCTRLDYAVATATDLAVLGIGGETFRQLRRTLMGTTTVPPSVGLPPDRWGAICRKLLADVAAHKSKASKTYYTKSLHQYFDGLSKSVMEMHRVMRPGGRCYVVVQDSYYKEVHVDLPNIVTEMALHAGFEFEAAWDFFHSRTYSGLNPHTEQYRSRHNPRESVVFLKNRAG